MVTERVVTTTQTKMVHPAVDLVTPTTNTTTVVNSNDYMIAKVNQIIWFIVGVFNVLLAIRFFLLLLGARRVGIVAGLLDLTRPLIAPYLGIFPQPQVAGAYFETASIVAFIAYILIGALISSALRVFLSRRV